MIKITPEVIEECATNLMFNISPEELQNTQDEFDAILKQMSFLSHITNIDEAEPMTFPITDYHYVLRDDVPSTPLSAEEELKMVPSRLGNQVKLPKVVG